MGSPRLPERAVLDVYQFGSFELLPDGTVQRGGKAIDLPPKQLALLRILAGAGGRLVPKAEILDRLWPGADVSEASLTSCVRGLRGALGDRARRGGILETVHGRGYRIHSTPRPARARIAVAPFAARGASQRYFAEGLAGEVAKALQRWRELGIDAIARESAERGWLRRRARADFARDLDLDYVVEGRVWSGARELRIGIALRRAGSRTVEWSEEFSAPTPAASQLAAEVAEALAKHLVAPARREAAPPAVAPLSNDPRAFHAVLRGRFLNQYRDENGLRRSIDCFEKAIRWDPRCVAAHVALAESWLNLAWRGYVAPAEVAPRTREALARALALDPATPLAHSARAFLAALVDRDPAAADAALGAATGAASAHDRSAFMCGFAHIAAGRTEDALRILDDALVLDPLSPNLAIARGLALWFAGRDDEALAVVRALTDAEPDFPAAQALRADVAALLGLRDEALRCAQRADALGRGDQMTRSAAAWAFARVGRPAEARAILAAFERRARTRYLSPTFAAVACAGLGDHEGALRWLARAGPARCMWLALAPRDPRLAELRSDPRFAAIVSPAQRPLRRGAGRRRRADAADPPPA